MGLFKKLFSKNKTEMDIIDFEKLFILLGLYIKQDDIKIGVIKQVDYVGLGTTHTTRFNKKSIGITDFGYIERFRVPFSFTKDDIEGLKDKLELQTNKNIDIEFISTKNGAYFDIKVFNHRLKIRYDFELIKPISDKLVVNIGYGRLGLVKFTIDKHIGLFGESGSGKSTTLKTLITQLVLNNSPTNLQLYLSDNKGGTELNIYSNIEHTKVFTKDLNGLKQIFKELNKEAESRYKLLFESEFESINEYNKKHKINKIPTILFVIEEYAAVYKDKAIKSMLQLALAQWRSVNIYILLTTQRPSSKILDGDLKCNLGIILGLKTLDSNNSNVVIDRYNLLNNLRGNGHGYIRYNGKLEEFQSFYIDHSKVKKLIKPLIVDKNNTPKYNSKKIITMENVKQKEGYKTNSNNTNKIGEVTDLSFLDSL